MYILVRLIMGRTNFVCTQVKENISFEQQFPNNVNSNKSLRAFFICNTFVCRMKSAFKANICTYMSVVITNFLSNKTCRVGRPSRSVPDVAAPAKER
jgi:hypothetical protein